MWIAVAIAVCLRPDHIRGASIANFAFTCEHVHHNMTSIANLGYNQVEALTGTAKPGKATFQREAGYPA